MGILFVAKEWGRYHYFKTEEERTAFINKFPEWERKFIQTYEKRFGKVE